MTVFSGYGMSLDGAKLKARRIANQEGVHMALFVWIGESGQCRYAIRHWDGEWDNPGLAFVAYPGTREE